MESDLCCPAALEQGPPGVCRCLGGNCPPPSPFGYLWIISSVGVPLCAHCPSFVLGIFFWLVQVLRVTVWEFIYEPVCFVVPGKCCFLKLICDPHRSDFLPPRLSEGCDTDTPKAPLSAHHPAVGWCAGLWWEHVSVMRNHFSSCSLGSLQRDISKRPVCDLCSLSNLTVSYNNKILTVSYKICPLVQ